VADSVLARLRDRLPVNPPYEGVLADAYDAWIPPDDVFADDGVYEHVLTQVGGPTLELGCGTGRPLLRWLAAGHDVEGVDASADMLAILRRHADEQGLEPVVHHGDMAPLDLPGRAYAAIVCPAGSFSLIDDTDRACDALCSYLTHLRPGGVLGLTLFDGTSTPDALEWRVRRTGTLADGTTMIVNEAIRADRRRQLQVVYNRLEAYAPDDGRLTGTWMRRHHLRWWRRPQIETLLGELGFVEVRSIGDDEGWVTLAERPGGTS
jgi:SAM-dependent methyltransferase